MILGITPARGGSKSIPRKNIQPLLGKPLIAWTIEAAQHSRLLDRYVVSTEDKTIAAVVARSGAEVIPRPKKLATDTASTLSVLQQVLTVIPADTVVVLQPTSPVRDGDLIDRCIRKFFNSRADSLATGFICKYLEYGKQARAPRRQDVKGFFYDDGSVYVIKADLIRKGNRYGSRIVRFITDKEQNIDIDDPFDFWLAEQVLRRRRKNAS